MSAQIQPWNGRFVWHDLMTPDAARSASFYCSMFGWQIHEMPMEDHSYRMILAGPGPVGGIVEEKGIEASHWLPYIAVEDVDAHARKCQELGGSIIIPPTEIPGTGRFAMASDPLGTQFSIYRGLPETPGFDPDLPVVGRVCWNELLTTDDGIAQTYYSGLFGWAEEPTDMGSMGTYRVQVKDGKQAGGIMKNPGNGVPDGWLVYFLVEDLEVEGAKAASLHATAMMEKVPIPDVGTFSLFRDPVGAEFALFQILKT